MKKLPGESSIAIVPTMASEIQLRGFISSNLGDSDFEPLKLKSFDDFISYLITNLTEQNQRITEQLSDVSNNRINTRK